MKTLRVGIVGYGLIGALHAQVIGRLPNARLAAVSDPNPLCRKRAKEDWGCDVFADFRRMLEGDIDLVAVCTPPALHLEATVAAAKAGKHVLVEKPMAAYLEDANAMVEACRRAGVKLGAILQHRFDPHVRAIKKALEDGTLGKPLLANVQVLWYRGDDYYDASPWRKTKDNGGGALMNQAIHYIDLMRYLFGPVTEVCALCDTLGHRDLEVEDMGLALLRFQNGAAGTLAGSTVAYPGMHARLDLFCQEGSVCIVDDRLESYRVKQGSLPGWEAFLGEGAALHASARPEDLDLDAHLAQYRDMAAAIREDREPMVNGEEGRLVMEVIEAIYAACGEKRWFRCEEVTAGR